MPDQKAVPAADGVRLAVLTSRIDGINRKMANTLFRTARSGVINSARDFSCCIVTAEDELLATAESLPVHTFGGPELMTAYMKSVHPEIERGDCFLHNSPYHGNSHAADHSLLAPVVDEQGRHRLTLVVKAHVADCGNSIPTTMFMAASDVYEEGALIFPCVKIQSKYQDVDDVVRMCRARIRVPDQWWGDYLAMLGAIRTGERAVLQLAEEVGWDALDAYIEDRLTYSENRMAEALRRLPSGKNWAGGHHDPVPNVPDGIDVGASVEVNGEAGRVIVDLRDNPDCLPCGLNLTEGTAKAAALVGVFNALSDPGVPVNGGSFRRVEILLRENCIAGIPRHPYSCSLATVGIADRIGNAVQRAIAELADGFGMAEVGFPPASTAVISGKDPRRDGRDFVNMVVLGQSGGAASPKGDAWLTVGHVGNAGLLLRDSAEIAESAHPVVIWVNRLNPDSEGAGRFRGSPSAWVEYGPVATDLEVVWATDGNESPPQGACGGLAGSPSRQFRRDAAGQLEKVPSYGRMTLEPGERLVSFSAGGGGYGSPTGRDPDLVAADVAAGFISAERAGDIYGVVVDRDGELDLAATEARRKEKR